MRKRTKISVLVGLCVLVLAMGLLTGCGNDKEDGGNSVESGAESGDNNQKPEEDIAPQDEEKPEQGTTPQDEEKPEEQDESKDQESQGQQDSEQKGVDDQDGEIEDETQLENKDNAGAAGADEDQGNTSGE